MTSNLVAVAGMPKTVVAGLRFRGVVVAEAVLDAVRRAGGEPVVLPPAAGAWPPDRLRAVFAAVVLPGGDDIDPERYGATPTTAATIAETRHDDADLALARAVVAARIPCLAICRGMQVLNVALGGTLVQDLPRVSVPHRDGRHEVRLDPSSLVARVMGTDRPSVSSYHHQGVARLAPGLSVTGRAADGVVEAIQHEHAPILAVQWHPEDDADSQPAEQALFDALLAPSSLPTEVMT